LTHTVWISIAVTVCVQTGYPGVTAMAGRERKVRRSDETYEKNLQNKWQEAAERFPPSDIGRQGAFICKCIVFSLLKCRVVYRTLNQWSHQLWALGHVPPRLPTISFLVHFRVNLTANYRSIV